MYTIDREKVRQVLLSENQPAYQIDVLLENFPLLPDEIGALIDNWLDHREIPKLTIDGISLKDVMEKHHDHFLVAIRDLSRLLDPTLPDDKRELWKKALTAPRYYE